MTDSKDNHNSLAGAYLLDALTPEERAAFEQHLEGCEICRVEVAELHNVVSLLPLAVELVEPPFSSKARLLDAVSIGDSAPGSMPPAAPVAAGSSSHAIPLRRRVSGWTASLAVAAAVIIAALAVRDYQLQQNSEPQASGSYTRIVADLASHGGKIYRVAGTIDAPGARAAMIQPAGAHEAYLVITGLSAAPSHRVYQLWLMRQGHAYSAATFGDGSKNPQVIRLSRSVTGYQTTGVTVEPGPHGSYMPTGHEVLKGSLIA